VLAIVNDLKFLCHTMFHPFDGFYELRFRRKQNTLLIAAIYLLCGLTELIRLYCTGMSLRAWRVYRVDVLYTMATAVFPYLVFAVSNWSVTTLFDGKGRLRDVLMVVAYALAPKLLFDLSYIGLSNIVTTDEGIMLSAFSVIGAVIFAFLLFVGLCVAHEYAPGKCVVTLLATMAAAVVIVFVGAVYMGLISKLISCVATVFQELTKRGFF